MPKHAKGIVDAVVIPLTRGYVAIVDPDVAEWAVQHNWHAVGTDNHIYACRWIAQGEDEMRKTELLHRRILECPEGMVGDHINGNTLDNRRENLRVTDSSGNALNFRLDRDRVESFRGCSWSKKDKRWCARINHNGKTISLGQYKTVDEAQEAYRAKCREIGRL